MARATMSFCLVLASGLCPALELSKHGCCCCWLPTIKNGQIVADEDFVELTGALHSLIKHYH